MASIENLRIYHHPNIQRAIKAKEIYVSGETGLFSRRESEMDTNSPWLFESIDIGPCLWCHKVLYTLFGLCPSPALDCWKVVVRPRNIVELMNLHALQKEMKVPCKCGIETRPNVAANYGGYFYNRSFEAGLEMKDRVRKIVSEKLSPDTPVFLKRGCTGIEEDFGPSDKWKMAEGQVELEAKIEKAFDGSFKEPPVASQPDDLAREIFETWLHYAHSIGDMSYLQITKGQYLHRPAVTYDKDSKF